VDAPLVEAAVEQMNSRFRPDEEAGAAAVYVEGGDVITSVALDAPNAAAGLCHEAGAFCEANRREMRLLTSVCVSREAGREEVIVLSPCGICQERLHIWGPEVRVAVPDAEDPTRWQSRRLGDVAPNYWALPFAERLWPDGRPFRSWD